MLDSIAVKKGVFLVLASGEKLRSVLVLTHDSTYKTFAVAPLHYVSGCRADFSSCLHKIPQFVSIYWK